MIYLDCNATTPLDKRVLEAMLPYLSTFYGNPSSLYRAGRVARSAIETAREQVATLVNVQASQVIFTSGGTEANNLALKGIASLLSVGRLAVSAIEHPSIFAPAKFLQTKGWVLEQIPVDKQGVINTSCFDGITNGSVDLVSIMLSNNETGVIQPVAKLAENLKQKATIHCDAVQSVGKMVVDFSSLNINAMTLSAHKIYGPKGVGALIVDQTILLEPLAMGGEQEGGYRAGTENVAAIVGFGKAAEIASSELNARTKHLMQLQKRFQVGLRAITNVTIFSEQVERLPNTVQFGILGVDGEMLLMQLDKKGFCVSSGSACASGSSKPSSVLTAMGVNPQLAKSAIRISFGQANTCAEVDKLLDALRELQLFCH